MNGVPGSEHDLPTAVQPARPTSVRWRILALLLAYSFMSWFNRVSMSVAGDEAIMQEFGISATNMGLVYSALLFSYALFMTPGGWFIDRWGPWTALVLMGFGSALFGALTGMVGWFVSTGMVLWFSLLVIRSLMGLFTAPIYPASGQIIANWLPLRQRALGNGLVMAAALVGIASTFLGFGALIDWFGWEMAFVITGLITALLALLWTAYATDHPSRHPSVNQDEQQLILTGRGPGPGGTDRVGRPGWWTLLRNRSLVLLTVSYAAVGYFEYLFYFWIHHYFEKVLLLGKADSRVAATVVNLAMAAGMFTGGWLADGLLRKYGYRLGRALVPVAGMLASAGLLLLGLVATEPAWIVTWFALALAAVGASEGPLWATAIELGGRRGGTAAGIFNTGGNVGGLLAPVITPLVGESFGWGWGISLGSVVCLLGASLWFWIDPSERCPE